MKWEIPKQDWNTALAHAVGRCADGDTIIVHSDAIRELAERAHARMCPDKNIKFEVKDKPNSNQRGGKAK